MKEQIRTFPLLGAWVYKRSPRAWRPRRLAGKMRDQACCHFSCGNSTAADVQSWEILVLNVLESAVLY